MSSKTKTLGILALGRSTFDVDYAEQRLVVMLDLLEKSGHSVCGSPELLFDGDAATAAIDELVVQQPDKILILQVTCLLYTSPSPRDQRGSRMPSSA